MTTRPPGWKESAGYLALCVPIDERVRFLSSILFKDYSAEDIDKAMSLFHAYNQAVNMAQENPEILATKIYLAAAAMTDALTAMEQIEVSNEGLK